MEADFLKLEKLDKTLNLKFNKCDLTSKFIKELMPLPLLISALDTNADTITFGLSYTTQEEVENAAAVLQTKIDGFLTRV